MSLEFITNNLEALADDLSLGQLRRHFINLAIDQNEFNSKKRRNEYMGTVISNSQTADFPQASAAGHIIGVKIRLDEAQGEYLPDYGTSEFTETQKKIILSCHGTAYSQAPLDDSNGERVPAFGERVVCRFAKESPDFYGRMRDLRYEYPSSGFAANYGSKSNAKNNNFGKNLLGGLGNNLKKFKSGTPVDQIVSKIDKEPVLIFGDSQIQPVKGPKTIGMILKDRFKNATRIGNHSWTAETYLYGTKDAKPYAGSFHPTEKKKVEDALKKKPALVIIGLGGNGVSSGGKYEKELLNWVGTMSPNSSVIWIGPPPPASNRKHKTKMESRKKLNETLQSHIGSLVSSFVNPYSIEGAVKIEDRETRVDFSKGYECDTTDKACDGIHVRGKYAEALLSGAGFLK